MAGYLLEAVLVPLAQEAWTIDVWLDEDLVFRWPWLPVGRHTLRLPVDVGGRVLVRALREAVRGLPPADQKPYANLGLEHVESEPLAEFLRRLAAGRTSNPLYPQLCWRLGLRLDQVIHRASVEGGSIPGFTLNIREFRMDDCTRTRAEREMGAYVLASKKAAKNAVLMSMALDKSRVFGKGLMNVCFALPSNTAWWSPPQVT